MSAGSPPPRTSWLDAGLVGPPRPRHAAAASEAHRVPEGSPGRIDEPEVPIPPTPSTPSTPPTSPTPATPPQRSARLERIYVITGGRSTPTADLDLVTLIVAANSAPPGLSPEQTAIMRLCRRPLSVAELSAHLRLPFSATAVLVADLLTAGLVVQRRSVRPADVDPELLKKMINGLRRL